MPTFRVGLIALALAPFTKDRWNQFAKFGKFRKQQPDGTVGDLIDFNETTIGQMVDNFARRRTRIAMDYDHQSTFVSVNGQPAPSLAKFNALALVVGGKVAKFATLDDVVTPPATEGREDGLYGYCCKVTPLGEQLLPNYEFISPWFSTAATDEQGKDIGYELINVAATDIPFLGGMQELSYHRFGSTVTPKLDKEIKMDPETMKKFGIAEGTSEEDQKKALAKYADDHEAMAKKFSELEQKCSQQDEQLKKFSATDEGDEKDKEAMTAMRRDLGLAPTARAKDIYTAFSVKTVPMSDLAGLRGELDAIKAERKAEKDADVTAKCTSLADRAVKIGYSKEKHGSLVAFAKSDYKAAEDFVSSLPGAAALAKLTHGGHPGGDAGDQVDLSGGQQQTGGRGMPEIGAGLSKKAEEIMSKNPKMSHRDAMVEAEKQFPDLARAVTRR